MQILEKRTNKYMNDRFLRGNSMNLETNQWLTSEKTFQFYCYIMKDILSFSIKKVPWRFHQTETCTYQMLKPPHCLVIKSSPKSILIFMFHSYWSFKFRRIHEVVEPWKPAYCKFKEKDVVQVTFKKSLPLGALETKDDYLYNKSCKMHFL